MAAAATRSLRSVSMASLGVMLPRVGGEDKVSRPNCLKNLVRPLQVSYRRRPMGLRVGDVARRTGVSTSTLRAWERRFGLLEPERTPGGQRLYDDADVERVAAVRRLVDEGLSLPAAVARVRSAGAAAVPTGEGESLFFGQILQAANQAVWVAKDGRTRYANRKMTDLLGCSLDALLSRSVFDFVDPEQMAATRERVHAVRLGGRERFEIELRRADGSTFFAEMTTSALQDRAGRYEGAVAFVSHITAR